MSAWMPWVRDHTDGWTLVKTPVDRKSRAAALSVVCTPEVRVPSVSKAPDEIGTMKVAPRSLRPATIAGGVHAIRAPAGAAWLPPGFPGPVPAGGRGGHPPRPPR